MVNREWTVQENLIIYYYMLKYPNKTDHQIALDLRKLNFDNRETFISPHRCTDEISLHIGKLRKQKHRLFIPDPVNGD